MKKTSSAAISSFSTAAAKNKMAKNQNQTTGAPRSTALRRNSLLFAPGAEVEVRSRFTQAAIVSSGSGAGRQVVIYARATVVSASAGTASYLVHYYPAADGILLLPSCVARVPASDVREPRRRTATAFDARPAPGGSSKRPAPMEQKLQEHGEDGRGKKAKRATTGRGIPMDALLRFFEEHEREEEEDADEEDEDEAAGTRRRSRLGAEAASAFNTTKSIDSRTQLS